MERAVSTRTTAASDDMHNLRTIFFDVAGHAESMRAIVEAENDSIVPSLDDIKAPLSELRKQIAAAERIIMQQDIRQMSGVTGQEENIPGATQLLLDAVCSLSKDNLLRADLLGSNSNHTWHPSQVNFDLMDKGVTFDSSAGLPALVGLGLAVEINHEGATVYRASNLGRALYVRGIYGRILQG